MGRKLLAVSGGVDSMVLLDLMLESGARGEIVVAYFNHGTRPSAEADQEFVRRVCREKGVAFVAEKAALGEGASEEAARSARYDFLFRTSERFNAEVYTAHHADDLAESVVVNLLRGTGWRGLAPMGDGRVRRPLLGWTRAEILRYAAEHKIRYRFDPTNGEDEYLRNRIREKLVGAGEKEALVRLAGRQKELKAEIDSILAGLVAEDGIYEREMFRKLAKVEQEGAGEITVGRKLAVEVLRFISGAHGVSLTYLQAEDFLAAILNYAPEKSFNLPKGKLVKIHKNHFKMI